MQMLMCGSWALIPKVRAIANSVIFVTQPRDNFKSSSQPHTYAKLDNID